MTSRAPRHAPAPHPTADPRARARVRIRVRIGSAGTSRSGPVAGRVDHLWNNLTGLVCRASSVGGFRHIAGSWKRLHHTALLPVDARCGEDWGHVLAPPRSSHARTGGPPGGDQP